jgi:lipopolysaccharide/colanic/teichoic acid biosynthesis glycosyltransferase
MKDLSNPEYSSPFNISAIRKTSEIKNRSFYRKFGKRAFDICLAVLLLPIIGPVILVVWALVRRDGGAGFYTQQRVGLNGKEFACCKLRTMRIDAEEILAKLCAENPEVAAEWNTRQKLSNDPRITRVGAFLRATSLDELPQLWNVLRGDMSFVGPRPFMASQQEMYLAAGGKAYFLSRPGITGMWQIEGRGTTAFIDRIQYDNSYYKDMSIALDLRLIMATAGVVLKSTGE